MTSQKIKIVICVAFVVLLVALSIALAMALFGQTNSPPLRTDKTDTSGYDVSKPGPTGNSKENRPWLLNLNICPPILCPRFKGVTDKNAKSGKLPGSNVVQNPFIFFEGDIIINDRHFYRDAYKRKHSKSKNSKDKRSIRIPLKLWTDGIVFYEIDDILRKFPESMKAIKGAMHHIQEKTCIRFKRKSDEDKDYIKFMYQPGCWSSVGREGNEQIISVGPGCEIMGTVAHELVHAIGFWHEQSRSDRGQFVRILKENMENKYFQQFMRFNKKTTTTLGFAYDYKSIMHYGSKYYSKNDKSTIEVIGQGAKLGLTIGQREGLSAIDIAQIKSLYKCNARHKQRHRKDKCYQSIDGKGRDYNGSLDYAIGGISCQKWLTEYPHDSSNLPSSTNSMEIKELKGHNKCRNPGGKKRRPWCYVLNKKRQWRYCSIKICKN